MRTKRRRISTSLTTIVALALLASACGSEPPTAAGGDGGGGDATTQPADPAETETANGSTAGEGNGGEGNGGDSQSAAACENAGALEELYAQVEGLTGEERANELAGLAEEEPSLNVYGSTNLDDAGPLFELFEDTYDLEPSYYRASSSDILNRILQETDAGLAGNDVVMANGPELAVMDQEGMLLPLNSPSTDDIVQAAVFDNWAAMYLNTFTAGWNKNAVSEAGGEDFITFLQNFDGQLAIELGDWDWFATLAKHLMETEGMTEQEIVDAFKEGVQGARVIDGHTLMAELLIAGEFDAATSLYHHRVSEFISEGAPLAWEPPVRPLIIRPNGIGIMECVQAPATALLWTEFVLSDGQQVFAENFRGPASTKVEGGLPNEYDPILVDIDAITNERDKWEGLWEEIVEATGAEPTGD